MFYFLYRGAGSLDLQETSLPVAFAVALGLGVGLAVILARTAIPAIRRNVEAIYNEDGTRKPTLVRLVPLLQLLFLFSGRLRNRPRSNPN